MKPKVVLYHPVPEDASDRLNSAFEIKAFEKIDASNRQEFVDACLDADGMIGMGLPMPTSALTGAKRLRAIATISTGFDAFDVSWLTEHKILLMNLFDPLTETTADLAFGLIMSTARRIVELDRKMRQGLWNKAVTQDWFGLDVHGKTLGIVGLGRIGSAIARRGALGCGMTILYTARSPKPEAEERFGARKCDLDELLVQSDFVCLALPLSQDTTHLIGKRELGLMKPTSILINIARGPVVDEAALSQALIDGTIHGAGLDVFETEPLPVDSPLMSMENVVLAPHIGSATAETRDAMARYAVESLVTYFSYGTARNAVNSVVLGNQ